MNYEENELFLVEPWKEVDEMELVLEKLFEYRVVVKK